MASPKRKSAPSRRFTPARRVRRVIGFAIAGAAVGAAAAITRPYLRYNGVPYDAMIALFVLLPALSLTSLATLRRVRWRWNLFQFGAEQAALTVAFALGITALLLRVFSDLVEVMAAYFAVVFIGGGVLYVVWQWFFPLPRLGPYCPACDYCLIGAGERQCPECGRPFTLDELGLTEAELEPK